MARKKETFHNLIDVCIEMENNEELSGKSEEKFRCLLRDCFFKNETEENKGFHHFFQNVTVPEIVLQNTNIVTMDMDELTTQIEGDSINDSLSGKIMLSDKYLKAFYSHHPPSFKQMPPEIQAEIIEQIKQKNSVITNAFIKMQKDFLLDKNRKIITLIALVLKNIFRLTGIQFKKLEQPANQLIESVFSNTKDVFTGSPVQLAELNDSVKVNQLVKAFFKVRDFNDINDLANLYKKEIARYAVRTIFAFKA